MDWGQIITMLLPIILPLLERLLDALLKRQKTVTGRPLSATATRNLARLRDVLERVNNALDNEDLSARGVKARGK